MKNFNYVGVLAYFSNSVSMKLFLLLYSVVYVCLDGLVGVCISRGHSNGVIGGCSSIVKSQ